MKKYLLAFLLMVWCAAINAASISQVFSDPSKPITVNAKLPRFYITQPANPTTGYGWVIKNYDHQLIVLISTFYQPPDTRLIGAGGTMVWLFQATPKALQQSTTTQIELVYQRAWDPKDNPTNVVFTVKIAP